MGEGSPLWSLAPMDWEGREPLRDWIYLSVSALAALADSTPSPFPLYPEIRNSDWGESFAQIFLIKLAFLRQKKSVNRLTVGSRGSGARLGVGHAPLPRAHLGYRFTLILLPKNHKYSKKHLRPFFPFGVRLILGFCETKNMQQIGTGTGHLINMLVPKII